MANEIIDDRHIRVFISSTFQDMEKEREELIKKVFPILRKKAAERGVVVTELDLRWGITKEESENGKVLEICLNEIDHSRPFFIGLLGDRYGWCPSEEELEKNHNIEELHPWVRQAIKEGKSVTEMEFLYGALSPTLFQDKHIDAYFWIKKSDATDDERLESLKEIVRNNIAYPCNDYATPKDLGEQVTDVFEKILEERYPPQHFSEVEAFKLDQQFYRRMLNDLYIPIQENLDNLDSFLDDDNNHVMVLTGEQGSGKSATISNWLQGRRGDTSHRYISCFLQASNKGAEIESVLDFINSELLSILGREQEDNLLGNNEKVQDEFKCLLDEASTNNIVLLIDGVNVLDDDDARLLNWLPSPIPHGCKVILSFPNNDAIYQTAIRKGFDVVSVAKMECPSDKKTFIESYLRQYGKSLTEKQTKKLTQSPISDVPGNLRAILNELKNNGDFDELDHSIEKFSTISNAEELYKLILINAENAFGGDFVANILLPIAVSRNGLDESTIIKIAKATPLQWSQLFCSFGDFLFSHHGLISISNNTLKASICERYYQSIESARYLITECINTSFKCSHYSYFILEVPYQWWNLREYKSLNTFLSSADILAILFREDERYLFKYWRDIKSSRQSIKKYYFNRGNLFPGDFGAMSAFMFGVNEYRLSIYYALRELIANLFHKKKYIKLYSSKWYYFYNVGALWSLGESLYESNRHYYLAKRVLKYLVRYAEKHPEGVLSDYYKQLGNVTIANCGLIRGKKGEAYDYYNSMLRDNMEIDDTNELESRAISLTNAISTFALTDISKVDDCFSEAEVIYSKLLMERPNAAKGYIALFLATASAYSYFEDGQRAKKILQKAMDTACNLKNQGADISHELWANIYTALAESEVVCGEEITKAQQYCDIANTKHVGEITDKESLSIVLLQSLFVYTVAEELEKAKAIANQLIDLPPVFKTVDGSDCIPWGLFYLCLGILYFEEKYFEKSIAYYEKSKKDLTKNFYYALAKNNLGRVLFNKGDYHQSISCLKTAIEIYNYNADNYNPLVTIYSLDSTLLLSLAYLHTHNIVMAEEYILGNVRKLETIQDNTPNIKQLRMKTFGILGDVFKEKGNDSCSTEYYRTALSIAENEGHDDSIVEYLRKQLK